MITTLDYSSISNGKVFLWSDMHFGHEVVMNECGRPWNNLDKMDGELIKNANDVVGEDDILITVGDITLYGETKSRYVERIVSSFPGKNILVYGNHDRFKPFWYLNRGFILVATSLVLPGGILVTHDPSSASVWPVNKPVLCGHVHTLFRVLDNVVNVGVDVWNYRPVLLEDVIKLCSDSRECRDWNRVSNSRHTDK